AFRCPACGRGYPVLFGIPDLRIKGDRYLNLEADRGRAQELDRAAREGASFDDLLELYWRNTPGTPPAIAARHVAGVRRSVQESRPILGALSGGRLLDAGCGSGGAVLAAVRAGSRRGRARRDRDLPPLGPHARASRRASRRGLAPAEAPGTVRAVAARRRLLGRAAPLAP